MKKPHALVVGGTGMLKNVCHELARQGYAVSVIARHQETLDVLVHEAAAYQGDIHPIALDWHDSKALEQSLQKAVEALGAIILSVVWIHRSAPEAPMIVAKFTEGNFFHVRPSSASASNDDDPIDTDTLSKLPNILYHLIILGSVIENGHMRWLTNAEISAGVIEAMKVKEARFVVGMIDGHL